MAVLGISCNVDDAELVVVVLRVSPKDGGDPEWAEVMRHKTDPGEDHAKKLASIQADLDTELKGQADVAAVVIRGPDRRPFQGGITTEETTRLELQGVALASARRAVGVPAVVMNGKQIGHACGMDKVAVVKRAAALFGEERQDAGMAALAALERAKG